jgi:glycosyltransferase involved in cell wall biosynthesis
MKNIYIVNNVSEGGAIKSYTNLLINSLKEFKSNEIKIINKQNNFYQIRFIKFLNKIYESITNKYFYKYYVKVKTKFITNLDKEIILIVPYVIQNQFKELDYFYEEISKKKFILVIHDLHIFHFPDKWKMETVKHVRDRYIKLLSRASKVVVHNEFTKEDVSTKFHFDGNKIYKIWLPPFLDLKPTTKINQISSSYDFAKNEYAIWPSSSTAFHKNHSNLLKAWANLIQKGIRLNLVCTGNKTPRWEEISQIINELHLEKNIFFTGVIPDIDLSQLIENAKFTICPTLFEGGGPVPAAESIMLKTPVLLSNIMQCKELMNNKLNNNYFFDPLDPHDISNKVESLLENYDVAEIYFQNFSKYYKESRTWENSADEYFNVLKLVD